ncbi:hypothetical protein FFF34_006805 [Inquilinus sp. KBS0705]|nr:hypothetical protein FFF34_006805 [Inquilinus sp. KBS0705]
MIFRYPAPIILFIVLFCAACQSKKADTTTTDIATRSQALITEHFKLMNEHELKSLSAQYAPKARISTAEWKGVTTGPSGADQIFHLEFYVSPDAKYLVDNMIVKDSTVIVEYDVIGLKDKANGVRFDLRKAGIFKTDGTLILSEATYANPLFYHNGN